MASKTWSAVDDYIVERLIPADAALEAALANNVRHGLPAIDVSAAQGKLLNILARMMGAKRILEIGTLGGYSTIWLARALQPGGQVVTLELEPRHAEVARANLANAGLTDVVDIRIGPALESLEAIAREAGGPFDLVFIDADKSNNRNYLTWAMKLSRPGTVIVCDNVVREGAVLEVGARDPFVAGVQATFDFIASEARLDGTAIQTVGAKGYDGFAIALVT